MTHPQAPDEDEGMQRTDLFGAYVKNTDEAELRLVLVIFITLRKIVKINNLKEERLLFG